MAPFAPGRFSTTPGWPKYSWNLEAIARPIMSDGPPATKGITTLIGLDGQACACAPPAANADRAAASSAAAILTVRFTFSPQGFLDQGRKFTMPRSILEFHRS